MKGIVLYTDGGARPNPGYAGSGIHGYVWDSEVPLKGIGLGPVVATTRGYLAKTDSLEFDPKTKEEKAEKPKKVVLTEVEQAAAIVARTELVNAKMKARKPYIVMPTEYIDLIVPVNFATSNNFAELNAIYRGLEVILHHHRTVEPIGYASILTDSELSVKGINERLNSWHQNGYRKPDGTMYANYQYWEAVRKLLIELGNEHINLDVMWVRGHAGEFGNEKADMMATTALYKAYRKSYDPILTKSPVEGYWKFDSELHPFVLHKCMYFNSGPDYHQPGVYNMGNHGKTDDLLGTRLSDGSFSHVRLNAPEDILESVVTFAKETCNQSDNLWVGYVTRLAMPATREAIVKNGGDSFDPMSEMHVGFKGIGSGRDPLVRMLQPPHQALRAITEVTTLSSILDRFLEGDTTFLTARDITAHLFDTTEVADKKGVVTKKVTLKADLPVGMPSIKLPADYKLLGKSEVETRELTLSSGIDILTRNAFKRLENLNPCIYVVTWSESAESFRYATIVKTDDAVGIWGGVYSNLFLVPKKQAK